MKKLFIIFFFFLFSISLYAQSISFLPVPNSYAINKYFINNDGTYFCHIDIPNIEISNAYTTAPYPICAYITNTDDSLPFENPNNILTINNLSFIKYTDDSHNTAVYKLDDLNFYVNDIDDLKNVYLYIICFSENNLYLFYLKVNFNNFPLTYGLPLIFTTELTNSVNINKIKENNIYKNNSYNINGIKSFNNNIYIKNNKKYIKK